MGFTLGSGGTVVGAPTNPYWSDTNGGGAAPCYNDGGADGGVRVLVSVARTGQLNAVLFSVNLTLSSDASGFHEDLTT